MSSPTYPLDTIAKLLDLSNRRVQQLAAEGVLPKAERGKYNLIGCVQGYIKFLKELAQAQEAEGGDYGKHRSRLTSAKADMAEMEREQLRNELIPADDIEGAWTAVVALMRSRLLEIPSKLAPRMVEIKDRNAARDLLEKSVHEALAELAGVSIEVGSPLRSSDLEPDSPVDPEAGLAPDEADDQPMGRRPSKAVAGGVGRARKVGHKPG